jgi:hypothetical protein
MKTLKTAKTKTPLRDPNRVLKNSAERGNRQPTFSKTQLNAETGSRLFSKEKKKLVEKSAAFFQRFACS